MFSVKAPCNSHEFKPMEVSANTGKRQVNAIHTLSNSISLLKICVSHRTRAGQGILCHIQCQDRNSFEDRALAISVAPERGGTLSLGTGYFECAPWSMQPFCSDGLPLTCCVCCEMRGFTLSSGRLHPPFLCVL